MSTRRTVPMSDPYGVAGFVPVEEHVPTEFQHPADVLEAALPLLAPTTRARYVRLIEACRRAGIVEYGVAFEALALSLETPS